MLHCRDAARCIVGTQHVASKWLNSPRCRIKRFIVLHGPCFKHLDAAMLRPYEEQRNDATKSFEKGGRRVLAARGCSNVTSNQQLDAN
jgi:hypothetical protein